MSYQACTRCLMDISDPNITFNVAGQCNHCIQYYQLIKQHVLTGLAGKNKLNSVVSTIKQAGVNKEYDCIAGISGGADSTYNMVILKEAGLRPLAIHLDNGWNAELAVSNIERVLKRLNVELYTHVIDWSEFRDLQLAYLRSGCVNIEALTDHAIMATLYHVAAQHNIKYICSGTNLVTEAILPTAWGYDNKDLVNILDIYKRFGSGRKLITFPQLTFSQYSKYTIMQGIQYISLLNYVPYNKPEVKAYLSREFGWKDYAGKHGESTFTYFYQSYILPHRLQFNDIPVDKRKAHLSCLVCANQMTREQALAELKIPLYANSNEERLAIEYVAKKLDITTAELQRLISLPVVSNYAYKTDQHYIKGANFKKSRAVALAKRAGLGKVVSLLRRH